MTIEGVTYYRYRVAFSADGRSRRWVRWAPDEVYAIESVAREACTRFSGRIGIGSVTFLGPL